MKHQDMLLPKKNGVYPFEITQAVIGLESGKVDKSVLQYFDFFTKNIPTTSAFFIHVAPDTNRFNDFGPETFAETELEFLKEKTGTTLQNDIQTFFPQKENMYSEFDLKYGNPLETLLDSAEKLKADLVVIGQKKGKSHHGILAKKFARKSKGNALVIPEKSKPEIKKILVPVDFSENSARALQAAVSIKKQLSEPAKLIALNVYHMPSVSSYRILKSRSKYKSYVEENIKTAFAKFLEKYVPEEKDEIEANLLFKNSPNMAGYLYSYAADNKVDFIVMGAKGHSRVGLLLMGSVTEKLLNINQSFPTLIVK